MFHWSCSRFSAREIISLAFIKFQNDGLLHIPRTPSTVNDRQALNWKEVGNTFSTPNSRFYSLNSTSLESYVAIIYQCIVTKKFSSANDNFLAQWHSEANQSRLIRMFNVECFLYQVFSFYVFFFLSICFFCK